MAALAVCFTCIESPGGVATQQIRQASDRFQMIGVNAQFSFAEMVQLHAGRNWSDEQLVGDAMSHQRFIVETEASIPARQIAAAPDPTRGCALNQIPKAANVCGCDVHTPDYTITRAT